ncbi:MAG: UvrB/UvrC motif-containing protein, partial [Gallicola sp.]|nr:UvrB/UvrC motif-containing protein [Gallicola sp.]
LREGLDLPEVSLIAILDADKEGFLRSETSLIQTAGRAARNINGKVIMFGDSITRSMQAAIDETKRRRAIQNAYNIEHNITPTSVEKSIRDTIEVTFAAEDGVKYEKEVVSEKELLAIIANLETEMYKSAEKLDFERAAEIRDKIVELKALNTEV